MRSWHQYVQRKNLRGSGAQEYEVLYKNRKVDILYTCVLRLLDGLPLIQFIAFTTSHNLHIPWHFWIWACLKMGPLALKTMERMMLNQWIPQRSYPRWGEAGLGQTVTAVCWVYHIAYGRVTHSEMGIWISTKDGGVLVVWNMSFMFPNSLVVGMMGWWSNLTNIWTPYFSEG